MAERDRVSTFDYPYADPDPYRDGVGVSDFGKAAVSGAAGVGSFIGAALRSIGEMREDDDAKALMGLDYLGQGVQQLFGDIQEQSLETMSPAAARNIQATITDPAFWQLSSIGLKLTQMTPEIAASVVPAVVMPGAISAAAMVAASGGAISAASVVDEIYRITDELSDEELQSQAPAYRQRREQGIDEETARREYNAELRGLKPLFTGVIGAITNAVGPAGQATRALRGEAVSIAGDVAEGIGRRVGRGLAEGSASEAVQSTVEGGAVQQALVESGSQEDIDYGAIARQAGEGALLGGLLGGGIGAAGGRGGDTASEANRTTGVDDIREMPAVSPNAPNQPGGAAPAPGPSATPAAGANPPDTTMPSRTVSDVVVPLVVVEDARTSAPIPVDASAPDPAQAAALATASRDMAPAPTPTPEVVTPVGNVQETQVETAARPPVAPEVAQPPGASPRPAVARPDPIPPVVQEGATPPVASAEPILRPEPVVQEGPRILEDRQGPDYSQQWASRVSSNIAEAEQPVETAPSGRNRTQAELAERAKTREGASQIAQKFPPQEGESGLLSRRPQDVQAARRLMLDRAKGISEEADAMGLVLPKSYRDSANAEANYNPETLLVMEAKRLANMPSPKPADFKRFMDRELSIRTGDLDQAVSERRAEGDMAMRRTSDRGVESLTDAEAPQAMSPEDILIRREEETGQAVARKPSPKADAQPLPARVQKALDDIMRATEKQKEPKKPVAVERVKKRKIVKPSPKEVVEKPVETSKPKVLSKIEEHRQKVREARERTNTKPTEAQKEAGNYAKGSVPVQGMTVRIENPKGSTRSGTDRTGRKWSVKLPYDYGYIEGSRGADGDAVDVYLGNNPDATYVYVVDQVDPDTRAFDEHKVMMGFRSEEDAYLAYDKAFSDNRGFERVGDLRKMTLAEFKAWLDTDPKERAGLSQAEVSEVQAFLVEEAISPTLPRKVTTTGEPPAVLPEGMVADPYSGRAVRPVASRRASDVMSTFDLSSLNPYQRAIAGQARRMMSNMVGNTPVHFVSPADMARLAGREGVRGVYSSGTSSHAIFVRSDLMNSPLELQHAVMHEAVHAATLREVRNNAKVESDIADVMVAIRQAFVDMRALDDGSLDYALTDPGEFVAEVLSNPTAQVALASIPAPDALVARLGLQRSGIRNAWDALVSVIRKALNLPANATSMLEAALRVTERSVPPRLQSDQGMQSFLLDGNVKPLQKAIREKTDALLKRPELQPAEGKPWLLGLRTMDSIARAADRLFGGADTNPFRQVARLIEAQRVRATKHYEQATPLLRKTHELQKRYEKEIGENGQTVWDNFTALTIDETMSGVYADRPLSDQKHIRSSDTWQKAQHPELARRFNALPEDLKAHRLEMLEYFKDQQSQLSRKIIQNRIVKLFDTSAIEGGVEGLTQRMFDGTVTDADKALLGDTYDAIQAAGVLSKIDGPYYPLMRRGNWVVVARQDVTRPGNAKELARNEFEFTDRDEALAWAAKQIGRPTVRTVYVDPKTGETFGVEDGQQVRLTAQDVGAEARYRVAVQDRNVEMFDTQREARARAAELANAGLIVDDVVPRNFDNYGVQAEALSPQIQRMMTALERRADARNFTPTQKGEMLQAVSELALQMQASTRIQSRSLPRRNVAGASKDLTRNIHDYALAMGNHVSKLDIAPQMDVHIQAARDYIDSHRNDGMNGARQEIYNEVAQRVTMKDPRTENSASAAVINRILSVSFIDKLMSPSYSVINATQPYMITMPYLAANYGPGRAWSAMSKAYSDIGTLRTIVGGFKDTMSKARNTEFVPTDPVSQIVSRLTNKREVELIENMVEWGALDTDAGLEVSKLMDERKGIVGKLDSGISYLEGIARQMPKAVEAINRTATALASYRLEMERSGDHAKAMQFAYDTINKTQFNYSHTNANRYMNHPVLRLATQFKKYGIGMYQHLGEQFGIAIDATRTPQERAAAIKALTYTIGMHVAVAGAMGLPTEPIKMIITTLNAIGVTDVSWTDVEIGQREAMAGLFGRDLGEALSRGIPRLAGLDLSTRMGIDTLIGPFGEPRSNEAQDLKAYMWDALAGAPAGLIFDMTGGVGSLAQGDVLRGMEKLVPIKAFADTVKAYRQMTEGSISQRTGRQVMSPYSIGEAVMRSAGFAPAREAEAFERSNMFYHSRSLQEEKRRDLQREWSDANGAARGRIWREIQKWNKGVPSEVRISMTDLRRYQKRMRDEIKNTREGIRARRREQHIVDRADQLFNFDPNR